MHKPFFFFPPSHFLSYKGCFSELPVQRLLVPQCSASSGHVPAACSPPLLVREHCLRLEKQQMKIPFPRSPWNSDSMGLVCASVRGVVGAGGLWWGWIHTQPAMWAGVTLVNRGETL